MWPPTPPAAYYHTRVLSSTHYLSITTATCPHPPLQNPHKMTWHNVMKTNTFLILHAYTEKHRSRALIATQKKFISAFLYFTLEACPPLYYSFLLSHTSHYSQTHFPISQIYFSLSLSLWNRKKPKMAKMALLFVLCVLPALAIGSRPMSNPFNVQGRVYCDTCRAGFETSATTYIPGT